MHAHTSYLLKQRTPARTHTRAHTSYLKNQRTHIHTHTHAHTVHTRTHTDTQMHIYTDLPKYRMVLTKVLISLASVFIIASPKSNAHTHTHTHPHLSLIHI